MVFYGNKLCVVVWSVLQSPTFLTVYPTDKFHRKHQDEPQRASCHPWPVSAGGGASVLTPPECRRGAKGVSPPSCTLGDHAAAVTRQVSVLPGVLGVEGT